MQDPTLYLTPECTLVYPSLFEPSAFKSEEPTYSATLLIPKQTDMTSIKVAVKAAATQKWGQQILTKLNTLRYPVRDGNEKAVDENGNLNKDNFYYNHYFIRAKSKWQPPIVNIFNETIEDPNEVYGGCIVRAYLSFYRYDYMGNKGISCGLRAVCKINDGPPIGGGRIDTAEVFGSVLKDKETFMDNPPIDMNGRDYNELGQMNYDPPQEPSIHGEDDIPF